jgi:serine/threonine protein kinase
MQRNAIAVSKSFRSSGKFLADGNTLQAKHFYAFGPFRFDSERGVLVRDGVPVPLAPKATEILLVLVERAGHLVDKETLIGRVWPDAFVEEGNLNKNVFFLRKTLGEWQPGRDYIETIPRRGYRFVAPVNEVTHVEEVRHQLPAAGSNLIGKKVSHYRVLDILGGGGMGVVYRAEDIKLGRRVALKFLPEESAKDPAALGRFEREARSASALEHPNICPIYEFGEYEGQPFLVMQLLEGQTLRELICAASPGSPPFTLSKLLDLAIQITAGLEAAHRQGIIHRDIKPANIFVTSDGQAKILDFGLAKLARLLSTEQDDSDRDAPVNGGAVGTVRESGPVLTPDKSLSLTGVAMGTAGYMSPEQIRGEKLDARTDLFSFGLVLYEMATGRRAFSGNTRPELHAAILAEVPSRAGELNSEVPAELEEIISRAVEKDRRARYQSSEEMKTDLQSMKGGIERVPHTRGREVAAAVVAVLMVGSATFWFAKRQSASKIPPPLLKLRQLTTNSMENSVKGGTISPDGKYLAYTDRLGVHIKVIESGETRTVPPPEEFHTRADWEIGPWFPDGTRFLANTHPPGGDNSNWTSQGSSIWIVSLLGGPPHKLREEAYADAISRDGSTITFETNAGRFGDREIWLMNSNGEQAHKLYESDENSAIGGVNWSPDERRLLFEKADESGVNLVTRDLKGGRPVNVLSSSEAKKLNDYLWLPDGRLIYALWETVPDERTCNYWQMRLDTRSGQPVEPPTRVTNWVGYCVAGTSVTADSKRLAFGEWIGHTSVYLADFQAGDASITSPTRLTLDTGYNEPLSWTADSKTLLFFSTRNGPVAMFKQTLHHEPELLVTPESDQGFTGNVSLSPDGTSIFYMLAQKNGDLQTPVKLMEVPITGGTPRLIWTTNNYEKGLHCSRSPATLCAIAERSPDHNSLIFSAFDPETGRGRLLGESKTDGSDAGQWDLSPDGNRIVILKGKDGPIQIISLNGDPLREFTVKGWSQLRNLDWTADGKGLFISSLNDTGSLLLRVDLHGAANILWENPGGVGATYGLPSPDGHRLAMMGWTVDNNMWMMENF